MSQSGVHGGPRSRLRLFLEMTLWDAYVVLVLATILLGLGLRATEWLNTTIARALR